MPIACRRCVCVCAPLLYSVQAFPLLAPKQRLEPWFRLLVRSSALLYCAVQCSAVYSGLACTPVTLVHPAAGRQLSCQGHFWPWLPYQASTACHCVPFLGFHYTLLHYNAVLPVRWSHLAQHDRPSLAWHSSACSTVCTLYFTASRSRMVSYFDLADCAELCVLCRLATN